jgi:HK97 family phage portal protein
MKLNPLTWFKSNSDVPDTVDTTNDVPDTDSKSLYTVDTVNAVFGVGGVVSPDAAMKVEAYYSCLRDKAETIGSLPLRLYQQSRNNPREEVTQGRYLDIFTRRPNDFMTMTSFLEMMAVSLERRGAFYALVMRNDRGTPMEIIPFYNQWSVRPDMDLNGNVYWTYTTNDGRSQVAVSDRDLFRVTLFSTNGVDPISPIQQCANLLGIAAAQDNSYKNLQEKGLTSQMGLKTPNAFTDPNAAQRLKDDFKAARGPNGFTNIPIFENGLEPVWFQLSSQEQELLGHKQFTIERICRMTRVPLHRVGYRDTKDPSKPFELDEAYMTSAINPVLVKVEQEINRFLPTDYNVEFNRRMFYQGSPWRLVEAVGNEISKGMCTINEGRKDLGREPVEGGDVFVVDSNNFTFGSWADADKIQERIYGRTNNSEDNDNG